MWRLGGLLALIAVPTLFLGQSMASAQGSTDDVQAVDLAMMALPLDAMPSEFGALHLGSPGFDPVSERLPGEVNAYVIGYAGPQPDLLPIVATSPALFTNADTATSNYNDAVADFTMLYANTTSTPITDLGDEAVALVGEYQNAGSHVTIAVFRYGRMAAFAVVLDDAANDRLAAATTMARSLFDRMKGVIAGDITSTSAPLPPDVNCDGTQDPVDAALTLQLDAGLVTTLAWGALGDANRDGSMNSIDAALILQYSAGLIVCLPAGTTCAA